MIMQKIVYIQDHYLYEINDILKDGWEVASLHPISTHTTNTYKTGAYVVLRQVSPKEDQYETLFKDFIYSSCTVYAVICILSCKSR